MTDARFEDDDKRNRNNSKGYSYNDENIYKKYTNS